MFNTSEESVHFVYEYERRRGYQWRKAESVRDQGAHDSLFWTHDVSCQISSLGGKLKWLRLRCSSALQRHPHHGKTVDPANYRWGKTKRCSCLAHVNIWFAEAGLYRFTDVSLAHNHPAVQNDHLPNYRPPTQCQKELVRELVPIKALGHGDIHSLLLAQFPDHPLSLRQVTNLLDDARRANRNSVQSLGGDFVAIVQKLTELKNADHRWVFHVQVDKNTRQFKRLFWMSPTQVSLAQRFSDVIINDIAMARNQYGLPLNVFVVIDQFFSSRNIAYSFHTSETADEHQWALDCLFAVLPPCPERVFFSDADLGLDLAVSRRPSSEIAFHGCCLNHLDGNIVKKIAPILGPLCQSFREAFWTIYYSISPSALEEAWDDLLAKFPTARPYLEHEIWPGRERWAWAYVAPRFTCSVRTSGRVEGENSVNKLLGNLKTSVYDLGMNLIARSEAQGDLEALRVRNVRAQHFSCSIES